ncbi:STAS domain-containing protein [Streptomyces sp. NPDC052287]|uniref:STAS domain-containing protein n=1 Tax=Streptomyces sp. NPDC052287 TaxID=3154950 RepID=UPI00341C505F
MSEHDSAPAGIPVVVLQGDIDATTVQPVIDELESAGSRYSAVVLDADGIGFADSTFLNILLRFHRSTDLRIASPSVAVRRLLEITGADAVLNTHPTVPDAQRTASAT